MMFVSLTSLFFINCTSHSARRKIIFCEDSYPHTIRKKLAQKGRVDMAAGMGEVQNVWQTILVGAQLYNLVADCLDENYISEV